MRRGAGALSQALLRGCSDPGTTTTIRSRPHGLHQLAVGEKIGWALQGLVALGFAIVLSPLHRRLESWIERLFFRAERLAILTLSRFSAECPFIEREARLLEMAVACRPRDGEQFAPEVRAALAAVAHHLGTAVTALRHKEHAQLVADLAAGRIEGPAARQRAISLVENDVPLRASPGN